MRSCIARGAIRCFQAKGRRLVAGREPDPQDDEALRCERCKPVFST